MKKSILFIGGLLFAFSCVYAQTSAYEVLEEAENLAEEVVKYEAASEVFSETSEDDIDDSFNIEAELFKADVADELESRHWNGKVEVTIEDELPQGIFAVVKGYFPGDSLTVENEVNQNKSEILIIGTLEQENETGIKITPEAAAELCFTAEDCENAVITIEPRRNVSGIREKSFAKISVIKAAEETEAESDIYAPISIIPAEESEDDPVETVDEVFEEPSPDVFVEESEVQDGFNEAAVEPEVEVTAAEEPEPVPVPVVEEKSFRENIICEDGLKAGVYFQIAFLKDEGNLQRFTNRYGKKYRMYYIPYDNGFKVVTGRFNPKNYNDELKKVKKDFPDAFVKKLGK